MRHSAVPWPTPNNEYYNPVSKIRALIQNLDTELVQLTYDVNTEHPKSNVPPKMSAPASVSLVKKGQGPIFKIPENVKPFVINSQAIQSENNILGPNNGSTTKSDLGQTLLTNRQLANLYRARVIDAYRNRRIFTVYGNYHTVRKALLHRGWVEKLTPGRYQKLQNLSEEALLSHAKKGNDYEAVVISKMINHFPAFFIWQPKNQRDFANDIRPYRNRIRRAPCVDFSTKVGLIGCAELEDWYSQEGISRLMHPRFYRLGSSSEERKAFIDDFRQTQCLSFLRFLVENIKTPERFNDELYGSIPISTVTFALGQAKQQLNDWENLTLDSDKKSYMVMEKKVEDPIEWESFIPDSRNLIRNQAKLKVPIRELNECIRVAKVLLDKIESKYGDYKWDGVRNLWILKPGYQSRGNGIIIKSSLDDILLWTTKNQNRKYIVQKYIERPLLVYKTKFDIRQYMLLTIGAVNVSIWLYKDCYLRFSSQEYTIDDLREAIHLTNNSVQKRYRNKQTRDTRLPKSNMWSLEHFKDYLKQNDSTKDVWNTRTYPLIKQNMIAVVQASLEETDFVENAFELYGCDFMLDENFNPILIEINATPDLTPSTEVTAQICPNVLRDTIRVVVDLPRNAKALTGQFEKVFEVNYKISRNYEQSSGLNISGTRMTLFQQVPALFRPRFWRRSVRSPKVEISEKKVRKNVRPRGVVTGSLDLAIKALAEQNESSATLTAADKEALALRYTQPK